MNEALCVCESAREGLSLALSPSPPASLCVSVPSIKCNVRTGRIPTCLYMRAG